MPKIVDRTGNQYRAFTVLRPLNKLKNRSIVWECKCLRCGNLFENYEFRRNREHGCGCLFKKMNKIRNLKHGFSRSRSYVSYKSMIDRCFNQKISGFKDYGGRGITVCKRWLGVNGLSNFIYDMGERPSRMSIDRINNNGNYEPSNCRWATAKEQQMNRRNSKMITYKGETHSISDWAEKIGMNRNTLCRRLREWTIERAFDQHLD